MIVAYAANSPTLVVATEAALLENDLETIVAVHYKWSEDGDIPMTRHKDVKAKNRQLFELNWKSKV